ncbi:unnamed protein product, partial [Owenia fusiformis]
GGLCAEWNTSQMISDGKAASITSQNLDETSNSNLSADEETLVGTSSTHSTPVLDNRSTLLDASIPPVDNACEDLTGPTLESTSPTVALTAPTSQPSTPVSLEPRLSSQSNSESPQYGPMFPPLYVALKQSITQETLPSSFITMNQSEFIKLVQLYDCGTVKLSVTVGLNFETLIKVHNQFIPSSHDIWDRVPKCIKTHSDLEKILNELDCWKVCLANNEEKYVSLTPKNAGLSCNASGPLLAYHESGFNMDTIRSINCGLLIRPTLGSRSVRCVPCQKARCTLRKREYRENRKPKEPSKYVANKYLSHSQLAVKASKLKADNILL